MHPNDPIIVKNRHTGATEVEQVYGENWLKRIYGNPLGSIALHAVVKRAFFSQLYGFAMDQPSSRKRIEPFVQKYGLNIAEFANPDLKSYTNFNEFFYRKLKPSARPIDNRENIAVLPADGRHLGFQNVATTQGVFAKGQRLDISTLVGDCELGQRYAQGSLVCSRLCPVDYHRFHFPVSGIPQAPVPLSGSLYSVNPLALRRNVSYLWRNKRQRVSINTPSFGLVTLVSIGATNVGSIVETYQPGVAVTKGDEKGYFRFGGSFIATLFEPGRIKIAEDLLEAGETGQELYAHMGSPLGQST
ncbi:phosphatidylserine decarboxylase [bacterium]|nr:phosphatidylserine decarboxylase [bacterium]